MYTHTGNETIRNTGNKSRNGQKLAKIRQEVIKHKDQVYYFFLYLSNKLHCKYTVFLSVVSVL